LVGEAIATGAITPQPLSIYTPLTSFPGALPSLQPATQSVTLGDLACFTAGFPDVGDPNGHGNRPLIADWGVADFAQAIEQITPLDYNLTPPQPTSSPAPYFYSDWSTGILGLLIANNPNSALPVNAVDNWMTLVTNQWITPLGMNDTYLFNPRPSQSERVVLGYQRGTAQAEVKAGRIHSVKVLNGG